MNLLTRIRSLWTTRPPEEDAEHELPDRARVRGDHHGRQRPLGTPPWPPGRRRPPGGHEGAPAGRRGGDRPRRRVARRLCLLDGELVAHARRDRHADGDLRRDDRPRVPRPRSPGREGALHRASRPRPGRASAQDGEPRAADDREHAASSLDRVRLRRAGRDRRGRAQARRVRGRAAGDRRERLRREPQRAGHAGPRPPHPHLGRAARLELPALAARVHRARVRRAATGRTSRPETSRPRCLPTPAAAAASAGDESAHHPPRSSRPSGCRSCSPRCGPEAGGYSRSSCRLRCSRSTSSSR